MRIVKYTSIKGEKPAKSATPIEGADYWYLLNGSQRTEMETGAIVLKPDEALLRTKRKVPLPPSHPLTGEPILDGPFPSGALPGDIRMNADGSFLVFYSIRPGAITGTETDLYLSLRRPDGT